MTDLITDWTPMPMPRAWYDNKPKRRWTTRRDHYAAMDKTGLLVTTDVLTPLIPSEPGIACHLDGILGWAALTNHPTETLHRPEQPSIIPLPLGLAWLGPAHQPLWCCTPLRPIGTPGESREYWHKRHPLDRVDYAKPGSINTRAGRWKEYRTPVRAIAPPARLAAIAWGHRAEIETLLAMVTHVGKKTAMGYGRVGPWTVTEIDTDRCAILAQRRMPIAYYAGRTAPADRVILPAAAWTAPYWYAPWWLDCITSATPPAR